MGDRLLLLGSVDSHLGGQLAAGINPELNNPVQV
jgi:hypothetical protein